MRWKAFFFENSDSNEDDGSTNNNKFGLKSRKCAPQNENLNNFEADVEVVHGF